MQGAPQLGEPPHKAPGCYLPPRGPTAPSPTLVAADSSLETPWRLRGRYEVEEEARGITEDRAETSGNASEAVIGIHLVQPTGSSGIAN